MKENSDRQQPKKTRAHKVTLRDIAESLGVSTATVSLAINNNSLVAKKTRQQVLAKIEELGYVYNRGAASLSTGETRTIGLAVHDFTNTYFTRVCASIETVLSKNDRMSFLCNTNESLERQKRFISALIEHSADGLILCPAIGTVADDINPLVRQGQPVVLIARDIEGAEADFVGNDDVLALKIATEHLIKLGHRKITMLGGGKSTSVGKDRRTGYLTAMREADLEVTPEMTIGCDSNFEGGADAVKKVLAASQPPTAIVCFNDRVALGAISELFERDLKPGRDIAVMGCDGIGEGGRAYARLSTVNVQKTMMGQTAAEILVSRLENPDQPLKRIILEPKLVIRSSCGAGN